MKRQTWFAALGALALAGSVRAQTLDGGTTGDAGIHRGGDQPAADELKSTTPQTGQEAAAPSKSGTFASNQVSGRISRVDKEGHRITVQQGDQEQTLSMGDNATIFLEGRLGTFDDLKEGQQVRAAYEPRDEAKSLRWIEVNPPAGGETASQGAAAETKNLVVGTVVSVDKTNRQLTLDQAGRQWTIDVTNNAPVLIEGRKATLADLREGQQVRCSLDPTKTTKTAVKVEAMPSATAPGTKPKSRR